MSKTAWFPRSDATMSSSWITAGSISCWASIALVALSNRAKSRERDASEAYAFHRYDKPVDRRGVGYDCFDVSKIHSNGNGACVFTRAFLAELNQALAIELAQPELAQSLEKGEACRLGPAYTFAYFLKIKTMQTNEIAKCRCLAAAACRLPSVDALLGFGGPLLRILVAKKCAVDILALSSDLDAPGGAEVATACALRVH